MTFVPSSHQPPPPQHTHTLPVHADGSLCGLGLRSAHQYQKPLGYSLHHSKGLNLLRSKTINHIMVIVQ